MADNSFGATFVRAASADQRAAFSLRFGQLQNTLIRRVNARIGELNASDPNRHKRLEIESKLKDLTDRTPGLQEFLKINQSNSLKLNGLLERVTELRATFLSEDLDNTTVTAAEAENFEETRDAAVEEIRNLWVVSNPEIAHTKQIENLFKVADELEAMSLDVGSVDPEGTENPNNNRQVLDYLDTLENKISTASTVALNNMALSNRLLVKIQQKAADLQADLSIMQAEDLERRNAEIDDLRAEFANALQILSLGFESQQNAADQLADSLDGADPPKGSILNLFA